MGPCPDIQRETVRRSLTFPLTLLVCLCFLSCGSDVQRPGTINNGNWWVAGRSTSDPSKIFYAAGPLVQTGNSVSGTFTIGNWAADYMGLNAGSTWDCLSTDDTATLSGTLSGSRLTLAGVSHNGGYLELKLEGTGANLSGTYTVKDPATCTGTGTVTATMVQPVDGSWTGSVAYLDGAYSGVSVNITVTQGTFDSTHGNTPITGSGVLYVSNPNNPRQVTPNGCVLDSSFVSGDRVVINCPPFAFRGTLPDPAHTRLLLGPTSWPLGFVGLMNPH